MPILMESLISQVHKDVYKMIGLINKTLDLHLIGKKMFSAISKVLLFESMIYIPTLLKSNEFDLNQAAFYKIDKSKIIDYQYADKLNNQLFKVLEFVITEDIDWTNVSNGISTLKFDESCALLFKPNKKYFQLIIQIKNKSKSFGILLLYKPIEENIFSQTELEALNAVIPYFISLFEYLEIQKTYDFKHKIADFLLENNPLGIIVLTHSMQCVYINKKAIVMIVQQYLYSNSHEISDFMPPVFIEDCNQIKKEIKNTKTTCFHPIVRHRILEGYALDKLFITSYIIENNGRSNPNDYLYMVTIEKMEEASIFDKNKLRLRYQLTERELEIAFNIFKGRTNAEIAKELFVSERTIKWHLKNIFQKMEVSNRTAMLNRMIENVQGGYQFGIF